MDPDTLRAGLARFAADLTFAGEPIAFDAVVERHIALFAEAQAAKLRWPSLARMLALAGARRADGKAISADQLRASVSRVRRRLAVEAVPHVVVAQPAIRVSQRLETPSAISPDRPTERQTPTSGSGHSRARHHAPPIEPDLSETEVLAARRRLLGA